MEIILSDESYRQMAKKHLDMHDELDIVLKLMIENGLIGSRTFDALEQWQDAEFAKFLEYQKLAETTPYKKVQMSSLYGEMKKELNIND